MADNLFVRLAEDDGATFRQIRATGLWGATDRDGMVIVPYIGGAMSREEAARLYCEDRGLTPDGDPILAGIRAEYAPYDTFPEFDEGFAAFADRNWSNPYPSSVAAQAWDRGLDAASRYARAIDAANRGAVVEAARRPAGRA